MSVADLIELKQFFKRLPRLAGGYYLDHFRSSFKRQGWQNKTFKSWKPRAHPLRKKRALLVKSGRLSRSLFMRHSGMRVVISTAVPYARVHNEGGRVQASVQVRRHKRRYKRGRKTTMVSVKAHKRRVDFTMPQRQFMGNSRAVDDQIGKAIEEQLDKYFRR